MKAIAADIISWHGFFHVGHIYQSGFTDTPGVFLSLAPDDNWHNGILAFQREFYSCPANGVGLFNIGGRSDVACRPLQIVSYSPVVLVSQFSLDQLGHEGCYAAQLYMSESIGATGIGQEGTVGMLRAFGYYDGAISIFPDTGFYFPQKFLFVERDLGKRMMCGASPSSSLASPAAPAIQPA